ncbi:hypothetical protein R6Q57_019486 [Mikania cordata]
MSDISVFKSFKPITRLPEPTTTWLPKPKYQSAKFDAEDTVSFALGRRVYEMSIPQFVVATGFYTEDEVMSPRFPSCLRGASKKNRDFCLSEVDLSEFWGTIYDSPFSTNMVEFEIRDPVLRYIHRVLACTVMGRYSGEEKVNWIDLFCLYCMVRMREDNLSCVLAQSFARRRRGGARARYRPDLMTVGPVTIPIDLRDLRRAGICERYDPPRWEGFVVGPQVMPPDGSAAVDVMRVLFPRIVRVLFLGGICHLDSIHFGNPTLTLLLWSLCVTGWIVIMSSTEIGI